MKQLSTRTITIISLISIAILVLGVFFVIEEDKEVPLPMPISENPENQGKNGEDVTETIDNSDWQTYRNEEYGFSFEYPSENEVRLARSQNADGIFVSLGGFADVSIFPQGEFDREFPYSEKSINRISLGGINAVQNIWEVKPSLFYSVIYIEDEYPLNWNSKNRIEMEYSQEYKLNVEKFLQSFSVLAVSEL